MNPPPTSVSSNEIARLLVHLAASEAEAEVLTPLRVQKLLYYVQGWSLATRGRPMFAQRIEAWKNGPVVYDVWAEFKDYGGGVIPVDRVDPPSGLSASDRAFVGSIWEGYKRHSAGELYRMTHAESPWRVARGGLPPDASGRDEITHDMLRGHFTPLVSEGVGAHQQKLDAAAARIESGAFETLDGLRRRVGCE